MPTLCAPGSSKIAGNCTNIQKEDSGPGLRVNTIELVLLSLFTILLFISPLCIVLLLRYLLVICGGTFSTHRLLKDTKENVKSEAIREGALYEGIWSDNENVRLE